MAWSDGGREGGTEEREGVGGAGGSGWISGNGMDTLLCFSSSMEELLPFPFPTKYAWVMTISIEYEYDVYEQHGVDCIGAPSLDWWLTWGHGDRGIGSGDVGIKYCGMRHCGGEGMGGGDVGFEGDVDVENGGEGALLLAGGMEERWDGYRNCGF